MRNEIRDEAIEVIGQAIAYGYHQLPFKPEDVDSIRHFEERGDNYGEPDWTILFKMKNGKFAVFHGGHDYTGWD